MLDLLRVLCQIYRNDLVAKFMAVILFISPKYHSPYSFNILTLLEIPYPAFKKLLPFYTLK